MTASDKRSEYPVCCEKDWLVAHSLEIDDAEPILVLDLRQASPLLLQPIGHDVRRIDAPEGLDVIAIHQRL